MANLEIVQIPVLNDNYVYLLHNHDDNLTAVIDPAVSGPVMDTLNEKGWTLTHILNTHHHGDHVGGNMDLKEATDCIIVGAGVDAKRIPGIDVEVGDGDTFMFGRAEATIYFTPGHTTGHICYHFAKEKILFAGDTLFAMGCGRLFEGTAKEMWKSLDTLRNLPGDTVVYCAHEYTEANGKFALSIEPENNDLQHRMSDVRKKRAMGQPTVPFTIEDERISNPFLRPESLPLQENIGMTGKTKHEIFAKVRQLKDNF